MRKQNKKMSLVQLFLTEDEKKEEAEKPGMFDGGMLDKAANVVNKGFDVVGNTAAKYVPGGSTLKSADDMTKPKGAKAQALFNLTKGFAPIGLGVGGYNLAKNALGGDENAAPSGQQNPQPAMKNGNNLANLASKMDPNAIANIAGGVANVAGRLRSGTATNMAGRPTAGMNQPRMATSAPTMPVQPVAGNTVTMPDGRTMNTNSPEYLAFMNPKAGANRPATAPTMAVDPAQLQAQQQKAEQDRKKQEMAAQEMERAQEQAKTKVDQAQTQAQRELENAQRNVEQRMKTESLSLTKFFGIK